MGHVGIDVLKKEGQISAPVTPISPMAHNQGGEPISLGWSPRAGRHRQAAVSTGPMTWSSM
jgi:hypothetical protein